LLKSRIRRRKGTIMTTQAVDLCCPFVIAEASQAFLADVIK
jgi:hypothetical protein